MMLLCISLKKSKDLYEYWRQNPDLAGDLQAFWGDSGPETMERVFPLRFYGDGADTIGLNTFELISMMSVAPHRSSSLKSRFVLLQPLLSHCLLCRG
jgi:hypothetical protein